MNGVVNLSFWQVLLAYLFVLLVLAIVRLRGIKREKEILISSVRMTVQLIATGYILVYVFRAPHPLITAGIILLMELFSIFTVFRKFRRQLPLSLKKSVAFAMSAGTLVCLLYFLLVVVQISPWYDPQYFVPIAGMLIGNSMTGVSLALKSMLEGLKNQKSVIEECLVLGAEPKTAMKRILNSAFDSAIMPTINSMVGMGIIFLPGMMTGQILSGTSPTTAIAYQISIMLGILGSVSLTVILTLQLGSRAFFNSEAQMIDLP